MIAARQIFLGRGAGEPTPPLPYDAEVEYLESTGTQYIDTGISRDVYSNIGFMVKLNPLVSASIDPVVGSFCGYSNWGSRWFGVNYTSRSSRGIQVGLGGSMAYYSGDMSLRDYDIEVSSVRGVLIDGTQIESPYGSDVSRSGTSFYLFATCARDGSGVNHISPRRCRIYNLTMYAGADVLEDLIPVRFTNELGQSEGAMYDRASGQLFRNAGTGAFLYGPDKS